jgi:predicted ester cyclase
MDHAGAIRAFYHQALNQRNLALVDTLFANVVSFPGGNAASVPREHVKRNIAAQLESLPNLQYALPDVIADGDRVAVRVRSTATHTATYFNMPPTGRPFFQHEICAYRFTNGQIDEIRTVFDIFQTVAQLGPNPVQIGDWNDTGPAPDAPPRVPPHQAAAFVRLVHDQVNRRNLDVVDQCFSPSFVLHGAGPGQGRDREAVKRSIRGQWDAFPDSVSQIEDIVSNGNRVAVFTRVTGTQTGPFSDLAPTGRRVDFRSAAVYELAQSSIVASWMVSQTGLLLQQIGAFEKRK